MGVHLPLQRLLLKTQPHQQQQLSGGLELMRQQQLQQAGGGFQSAQAQQNFPGPPRQASSGGGQGGGGGAGGRQGVVGYGPLTGQRYRETPTTQVREYDISYGRPYNTASEASFLEELEAYAKQGR